MVTLMISFGLKIHFIIKSFLQIDTGLIGQAKYYKNHIGKFFSKVLILITFFLTLLPISSGDNSCYLSDFLCQLSHIGKFIEITNSVFFYPLVNFELCIF